MRQKEKKAFSESRKHSRFKVSNWSEYNDILRFSEVVFCQEMIIT